MCARTPASVLFCAPVALAVENPPVRVYAGPGAAFANELFTGCRWAAITCAVVAGPVTGACASTFSHVYTRLTEPSYRALSASDINAIMRSCTHKVIRFTYTHSHAVTAAFAHTVLSFYRAVWVHRHTACIALSECHHMTSATAL